MKTLTPELTAALYSPSGLLEVVHLFTFYFAGGTQRWSSDGVVTFAGTTWAEGPRIIGKPKADNRSGLEVGKLDVELAPTPSQPTMKIDAINGVFDKVRVIYQRGYFTAGVCQGVLTEFDGTVAKVKPGSTTIVVTVKSIIARLKIPIPRRSIQSSCPYKFGDPATCKALTPGPCDKTRDSTDGASGDCRLVHNNIARFGGFPDVPSEKAR